MLAVLSNVGRVVPEWLRERLCEGAGVCKSLIVTAWVVVFGVWWVATQDYCTWISFARIRSYWLHFGEQMDLLYSLNEAFVPQLAASVASVCENE